MSQVNNVAKISVIVYITVTPSRNNCIIERGIDTFIGSNKTRATTMFFECIEILIV